MSETFYLELNDTIGPAPAFIRDPKSGLEVPNPKAGEPDEINHLTFRIPVPVALPDGQIANDTRPVDIVAEPKLDPDHSLASRVIPGTRIIETRAPAVVDFLVTNGICRQVDQPKSEQPRKPHTTPKES
jgi:hypothetical protein